MNFAYEDGVCNVAYLNFTMATRGKDLAWILVDEEMYCKYFKKHINVGWGGARDS